MKGKTMRLTSSFAAIVLAGGLAAQAGEPSTAGKAAEEKKGPLAALPSKPGPHVEKIKALGDGGWLNLGRPAPDPKWGLAPGRSYTCKMAAAPDLGGAFLYGEGVHGGSRQQNGQEYYNDDLFFYDLNAHAWVCCYPGTQTKGLALKFDPQLKCEVDEKGEPVPVAVMIHGYADTAYSPKHKVFAGMPNGSYFWPKALGHYRDWKYVDVIHKQGPWLYHADTGKWELRPNSPRNKEGGVLECVQKDGREQIFRYHQGGGVWFFDIEKLAWSEAKPKGPHPPWGMESNACYDTKRGRIYMGGGQYPESKTTNALWAYDLKDNALIDLQAKDSKLSVYATWGAVMTYDSVNDKVVLTRYKPYKPEAQKEREPAGVFVYDPETNAWTGPQEFPKEITWKQANGFYDAATNAHYYHSAGDSERDGVVMVYRLKAGK
jgi:hypothetical protein